MKQEVLDKILVDHKIWLESDGGNGKKADLSNENLAYRDLSGATLIKANLCSANLVGANLKGAQLAWTDLRKANLDRANLSYANLTDANLSDARLSFANLKGANLREAVLYGTRLWETILVKANFIQSKWVGVDAYNLTLDEVDLSGSVMIGIRGVEDIVYKKPVLSGIVTDGLFYSYIPLDLRKQYEEGFVMVHRDAIVHSMAFPEELKEAGMSLLSYFHTVIKQKFPRDNVSLTLRQDELLVTMIIEPPEGTRGKYENEFKSYSEVLKNEIPMQKYFSNREHILRLENQLEIAKAQISTTDKILRLQDQHINEQGKNIDMLIDAINVVASKNILPPININLAQLAKSSADVQVIDEGASEDIQTLLDSISKQLDALSLQLNKESDEYQALDVLNEKIRNASESPNAAPHDTFAWVHRLGEFITSIKNTKEHVDDALDWSDGAIETFNRLISLYNKIAEILTLPEI